MILTAKKKTRGRIKRTSQGKQVRVLIPITLHKRVEALRRKSDVSMGYLTEQAYGLLLKSKTNFTKMKYRPAQGNSVKFYVDPAIHRKVKIKGMQTDKSLNFMTEEAYKLILKVGKVQV